MTSVRWLSPADAAAALARQWAISPRELSNRLPPDALVADYLRSTIRSLSGANRLAAEPVYVTTLLNSVRGQLSALWPDVNARISASESSGETDDPDPIRRVLDGLAELRDCAHIGRGYWLPTPPRLVSLSDEVVLVVGGWTTTQVEHALECKVTRSGISRTVSRNNLPQSWVKDETRWQTRDNWMGTSPADLAGWLRDVRQRAQQRLVSSSADTGDFDVYAPRSAQPGSPQWFRWVSASSLQSDGNELVLCRTRGGYFNQVRYWWGELSVSGRGVRSHLEADVGDVSVRRIQYGVDLEHRNPTVVDRIREPDAMTYILRSALPPEERRLMVGLTTDVSATSGKYPTRLRAPLAHAATIDKSFAKLGIEFTNSTRSRDGT